MKKMKVQTIITIALSMICFVSYCKEQHYCNRKHGQKRFQYLDKDNDKKVSKTEWAVHFEEMDENKDGQLTRKEIKEHHKKQCEICHKQKKDHDHDHKDHDDKH